jgi:MFS family permease
VPSSATSPPVATADAHLSTRAWSVLIVLCGALFLDALDVSMMGVTLPSIGADLDMAPNSLQWVVSSYVLGYGGFLLLGGRAADLFGRRRMFVGGLTVFTLFSGLGGLADGGTLLVIARFVTGVGAAFTAPAGLSIITTTFAEGPARNRALTIYGATGATGFALGLVVGGLLTEAHWRLVFFVPVALALLILAAAVRLVPHDRRPERTRRGFDVAGAVTVTAAMLLLVTTLVEAPQAGWASGRTLGSLVGVAALLALFVAIERRTAAPLLRLGILRSADLVRANVGALVLTGGWVATLFVVTLYMQEVRGWSAIETGLAVFPSGPVAAMAPRIAPPLVARFGVAPVVAAGLASHAIAYALLLGIGPESSYVTVLLPAFLLVGFGFALAYGPLSIGATNGVAAHEQGVAGGLVNTSLQLGPALVLAVTAAANEANVGTGGTAEAVLDGFHAALLVPLVAVLIGLAVTVQGIRRRPQPAEDRVVAPADAVVPVSDDLMTV